MFDAQAHKKRLAAYMDALGDDATAVVASPPERIRNGDAHYRFRQSSDLHYLLGFPEPEAVLVLRPGAKEERVVLFTRPRDPEREIWDGRRAGTDGARDVYGVEAAYPIEELDERLPELIANFSDVHYSVGVDGDFDARLLSMIASLRRRERRGSRPPVRIVDPLTLLHELRLRKDDAELDILRRAAAITDEAHRAAMKLAAPGVFEYELEAVINYTFRRRGGSGPGYSSIVGSGANATILHYVENDRALEEGDLVLIDAGGEYGSYTADVTRTFPVSGTFSSAQRAVYEIVLHAEKSAIDMVRPGITIDDIHQHCVEVLTAGMVELGLLEGDVQARIDDESYKRYYMHRTSHWLGLDVHDVGAYTRAGQTRPLESGMVITVEPGIYISEDDTDAPSELRGIGVRIEDDIVVTNGGFENLTKAIPKEVDDVEAACRT